MTSAIPNSFWQLPPAPLPPNDPTFWLLNGRVGWQAAELDDVAIAGDNLGLLIIPGSGRLLTEPSGSFGGLVPPGDAAVAADGSLYLLDLSASQLKRFDPCDCQFNTVPCLGGPGTSPRQLQDPHGIGICSGNLFICDTGNHRLVVFSMFGFVLRNVWKPPASAGLTNPWQPYGIAFDHRGRAYVTDPANGCIHRFQPSGSWDGVFAGFGDVHWITIDCHNRIYTLSEGESSARITDLHGKSIGTASRPDEVASYFPRLAFTVDAHGDTNLSAICKLAGSTGSFSPGGQPLASPPPDPPVAFTTAGTYWSNALDSQFYRCQWHRIILRGKLPPKTGVKVYTYTSDVDQPLSQIQSLPDDASQSNRATTVMARDWEGLIFSGPGR